MLDAAIAAIDAINANDPKSIPDDSGRPAPFRLQYSKWLTAWVQRLDPNAMDELLILARGKRCGRRCCAFVAVAGAGAPGAGRARVCANNICLLQSKPSHRRRRPSINLQPANQHHQTN